MKRKAWRITYSILGDGEEYPKSKEFNARSAGKALEQLLLLFKSAGTTDFSIHEIVQIS